MKKNILKKINSSLSSRGGARRAEGFK